MCPVKLIFKLFTPIYKWNLHLLRQTEPEVFCKKSCTRKFGKFHKKGTIPVSLFNKLPRLFNIVTGLQLPTSLKKDSGATLFSRCLWIFSEHLLYISPVNNDSVHVIVLLICIYVHHDESFYLIWLVEIFQKVISTSWK